MITRTIVTGTRAGKLVGVAHEDKCQYGMAVWVKHDTDDQPIRYRWLSDGQANGMLGLLGLLKSLELIYDYDMWSVV